MYKNSIEILLGSSEFILVYGQSLPQRTEDHSEAVKQLKTTVADLSTTFKKQAQREQISYNFHCFDYYIVYA